MKVSQFISSWLGRFIELYQIEQVKVNQVHNEKEVLISI